MHKVFPIQPYALLLSLLLWTSSEPNLQLLKSGILPFEHSLHSASPNLPKILISLPSIGSFLIRSPSKTFICLKP